MPTRHSYLADLEKRIRECFEINCDSQLSRYMKEADNLARLQTMVAGNATYDPANNEKDPNCDLFCVLRAYFLNHLKSKPDQFNCGLYEEVSCLVCPVEYGDSQEYYDQYYASEIQEATSKLLYYIQRYQFDCVLGDLVFSCQEPCEAHCLVLGTVEVVDGKLVRVCNTPRTYLWSPANLLQVLTYTVITVGVTSKCGDADDRHCCPDYKGFNAGEFLKEFGVNECGRYFAAKSAIDAFRAVTRSIHRSFDYTESAAVSHILFNQSTPDAAQKNATTLGLNLSVSDRTSNDLDMADPIQSFLAARLLRRGDSLVAYKSPEGKAIGRVFPDFVAKISPDPSVGGSIEAVIEKCNELSARVAALENPSAAGDQTKKGAKKSGSQPTKDE
jgi:hypothetical protein